MDIRRMTRAATKSWKTTLVSVLAFIGALVAAVTGLLQGEEVDWNLVIEAGILAAISAVAFFSRDADISSKESQLTSPPKKK